MLIQLSFIDCTITMNDTHKPNIIMLIYDIESILSDNYIVDRNMDQLDKISDEAHDEETNC